ncbi:ABC transporter ATP-binding protein [Cumulibacter manganitolerans]|uniref:ABC transporter ATP-binding protein n=1 Tax=Cumulibacter manganitolerans TaxID=1884992 RepID=UPI001297E387|nr:ABC transporter ATP-binding protein [Cumulibacter manganitolerans]
MITVAGLGVTRAGRRVLEDIGFELAPGSITGLLGASGAGKTTLMRALLGVQRIQDGTITVDGLPAGRRELRSRVGYVTQSPAIYPDLTVAQNVDYFGALYGAGPAQTAQTLEVVGLGDRGRDLVANLSGGQRGRVSLACALVGRPRILIMDEPTVGLDPLVVEALWHSFRRLADDGTTLLISSHVMDEADRCERVLFLRDGRLIADGSPLQLRARSGCSDMNDVFIHFAGVRPHEEVPR